MFRYISIIIASGFLSLLFLHELGAKAVWQVIGRDDGVFISSRRDRPKSLEMLSSMTVPGKVREIAAIAEDASQMKRWFDRCLEVRTLKKFGPNDYLVYMVWDSPWPARDRDEVSALLRRFSRVRITEGFADLTFQAVSDAQTRVHYHFEIDPKAPAPASLLKLHFKKHAFNTMKLLKGIARKSVSR